MILAKLVPQPVHVGADVLEDILSFRVVEQRKQQCVRA